MNSIANVLDVELNGNYIIEIGITMVDLRKLEIIKTVSMPIWPQPCNLDLEIKELTGWTDKKLEKSGISLDTAFDRIVHKYGGLSRVLIVDNKNELEPFEYVVETSQHLMFWDDNDVRPNWPNYMPFGKSVLNVADIFKIATNNIDKSTSLPDMLNALGKKFEGRWHRADSDSRNIAVLFITLMQAMRKTYAQSKTEVTKNENS